VSNKIFFTTVLLGVLVRCAHGYVLDIKCDPVEPDKKAVLAVQAAASEACNSEPLIKSVCQNESGALSFSIDCQTHRVDRDFEFHFQVNCGYWDKKARCGLPKLYVRVRTTKDVFLTEEGIPCDLVQELYAYVKGIVGQEVPIISIKTRDEKFDYDTAADYDFTVSTSKRFPEVRVFQIKHECPDQGPCFLVVVGEYFYT